MILYVLLVMFQPLNPRMVPCHTLGASGKWVRDKCQETQPLQTREPFSAFTTKAACEKARNKVRLPPELLLETVGCVRVIVPSPIQGE